MELVLDAAYASSGIQRPPWPRHHAVREERAPTRKIAVSPRGGSSWVDAVIESFGRLSLLSANWDGRGSFAVNFEDVHDALMFLERVMRDDTQAPGVVPLNSGGIELSWRASGLEVEAVFDGRRDERVLLVTAGANESEEPIEYAEKLFSEIVGRLAAPSSS